MGNFSKFDNQKIFLSKRHPLYLQFKMLTMSPIERAFKKLNYSAAADKIFEDLESYSNSLKRKILTDPKSLGPLKKRNLEFMKMWRKENLYEELIRSVVTLTLSTYFFKKNRNELFIDELEDKILNIQIEKQENQDDNMEDKADISELIAEYTTFVLKNFNYNREFITQEVLRFRPILNKFKAKYKRCYLLRFMGVFDELKAKYPDKSNLWFANKLTPFLIIDDETLEPSTVVKTMNPNDEEYPEFRDFLLTFKENHEVKKTHISSAL